MAGNTKATKGQINNAVKLAKELFYPIEYQERLRHAKTLEEIDTILSFARNSKPLDSKLKSSEQDVKRADFLINLEETNAHTEAQKKVQKKPWCYSSISRNTCEGVRDKDGFIRLKCFECHYMSKDIRNDVLKQFGWTLTKKGGAKPNEEKYGMSDDVLVINEKGQQQLAFYDFKEETWNGMNTEEKVKPIAWKSVRAAE